MKLFLNVLIAAVSVNCILTTINGKAATHSLAAPYTDMLLPPLQNMQDNIKHVATKKPINIDENNILPELSIETLLPPLFEPKTEKAAKTTSKTSTKKPTTQRPIIKTNKTTYTTAKPSYTITTTLKPYKLKVAQLFLDSLLPPLLHNDIVNVKDEKVMKTTQKHITTTKKSYYQQKLQDRNDVYSKNYKKQQQQVSHVQNNTPGKEAKIYNKPSADTIIVTDKQTAESHNHPKQVSLTSQRENMKLKSRIETVTKQYAAQQKVNNSKYNNKQFNYNFGLYLGSTTPKPPKKGLPTITPFPHRLGR